MTFNESLSPCLPSASPRDRRRHRAGIVCRSATPREQTTAGIRRARWCLVAAIADCFILTFRGVSRAAYLEWNSLDVHVEDTLERLDGVTRVTRYLTRAALTLKPPADGGKARELLERAEKVCLVANSLHGDRALEATLTFEDP